MSTDDPTPEVSPGLPVAATGSAAIVPAEFASIAGVIGADAAEKLAAHFPGAWHYLAVESYAGPLPGLLADIDRVIGRELTLVFARHFGGKRVYIPKKLIASCPIVQAIGMDAAKLIVEHVIAGENVQVPLGPMNFNAMRTMRIRSLIVRGIPAGRVAQICGVHERTVYYNMEILREFGVIEPRDRPARSGHIYAQARLLLSEDRRPDDVAEFLKLPLDIVLHEKAQLDRIKLSNRRLATSAPSGSGDSI